MLWNFLPILSFVEFFFLNVITFNFISFFFIII